VASVSIDATLEGHATHAAGSSTPSPLRVALGVESRPETGLGVGVAVVDSGIFPSPELKDRISAFYDFTRGGRQARPSDEYGHGTHIAGLIASSGERSDGK
jgi:serine protease AprX